VTTTRQFLANDFATLDGIVRWRAAREPEKQAYTFLEDGHRIKDTITYCALDRRARAIAAVLQDAGVVGRRAILLYPSGLQFIQAFLGCLYAGVVAVPAPPPPSLHAGNAVRRLHAIAGDVEPSILLSTSTVALSSVDRSRLPDSLNRLAVVLTDDIPDELGTSWNPISRSDNGLAYIQYTSGSTAEPKGVMLSHENLLRNLADLDIGWDHDSHSILVSWLPMFHDMGLIYGVFQGLYNGFHCYLMSPFSFIRSPFRWLDTISRFSGTHAAAPNFAYDLCVQMTSSAQRKTLNLSSWKVALNGAEPIRNDTLERFTKTFEPCGFDRRAFCPGYGLAEATLKVTTTHRTDSPELCTVLSSALEYGWVVRTDRSEEKARTLVGSGCAAPDTKIVIANPQNRIECEPHEVGEIWVSGPGVAAGYWRRPDETERTFRARLQHGDDDLFLRTGDLGFLQNGQLFVVGRIKDVMIIRGKNHHPQDIEATVQSVHSILRKGCGIAFSIDVHEEERLVVVQEVDRNRGAGDIELGAISKAIRQAVAKDHEVDPFAIILVEPGSVDKTSSGKLERHACRAAFLANKLKVMDEEWNHRPEPRSDLKRERNGHEYTAPRTQIEEILAGIFSEVLDHERIGALDNFFELGGDSLKAARVLSRVRATFGINLPMGIMFLAPSVAELAIIITHNREYYSF
jgi:acyl-CoA synthetase (AMP-forming)/AMP-acid ligase II/acyl carrier protein